VLTVPLPKDDKAFQEEVDSDIESDDLDEEDLELLEASAGELEFLHKLPKKDIDKAVSQTREKKPLPRHTEDNRQKRNVSDIDTTESSDLEFDESSDGQEDSESEEEDWEKGPRKIQQEKPKQVKKHRGGSLPVKSLDGDMIEHPDAIRDEDLKLDQNAFEGVTVLDDGRASKKEEKLKLAEMERKKQQELRELQKKKEKEQEEIRLREEESKVDMEEKNKDKKYKEEALQCLQGCKSKDERRGKAKFVIAKACQTLLGDPEHQLRKQMPILLELIGDHDITIVKLSMLSVLAIMRDIIPSYRIRPIHEREKEDVVQSKEVKELWDHENLLLKSYQSYLKVLLKAFKNQKDGSKSAMILSRAAAKCLSSLVVAAPHFNFSGDILQVIVPAIANKDEEIKLCCSNAITSLVKEALSSADSGQCAVEATQLLADFVKRRKCVGLPPQVVSCLLDFSFPDITSAEDLLEATKNRKKKKKKKKGKDDVNRAFKEAQAVVDRDTRRHQQSVVLEAMFEIYFRVLKTTEASLKGIQQVQSAWPPARFAKRFPLMAPTLQGLAKFSHLISVDYFHDLIVTLENILESPCLPHDIRCRILLTASEISKGQGESLNIDRAALYRELYRAMYSATEIPMEEDDPSLPGTLSDRSMTHLPPTTLSSVVPMPKDTQQYLLSKILEDMLLDSQKTLDIQRQAAFTKRAATIALQATDSGLVLAMLYVIYRMLKRYPKLRSMIEDDEGAGPSSNYYGSLLSKGQSKKTSVEYAEEDPAIHTGALYTPLWELSILSAHHANPGVRQAANFVAMMSVSAARAAATGTTGESASELGHVFPVQSGSTMSPSTVLLRNTTYFGAFAPPVKGNAPKSHRHATGSGPSHQEERPVGRWIGILDENCPAFETKPNIWNS